VLGFYLTSHPLSEHEETLKTYCTHTSVSAATLPHRTEVLVGGMLSAIKFSQTKTARAGSTATKYAMFDLEDLEGMLRCILWPDDFVNFGHLVQPDAILVARGVIDKRPGSDEANLIVNELIPVGECAAKFTKGVVIRVQESTHSPRTLEQLHEVLRGYPGDCDVQLVIYLADGCKVACKCRGLRVSVNAEMRARVEDLLGSGNFRLVAGPRTSNGHKRNGTRRSQPAAAGAR
jgi:DNA polymerase-3 subunit alpha